MLIPAREKRDGTSDKLISLSVSRCAIVCLVDQLKTGSGLVAILSVALTRCLASFSFSILFFQHNPLFIAPFKPKSHTARSWTHRHTHCILINTCASTNRSCMLVNTFTQTHHSRPQKPLRSWPAPRTHTAHLYGIQL